MKFLNKMPNKIQEFIAQEYASLKAQPALRTDFKVGDIVRVHQLIKEIVVQKKISKTAKAIKKADGDAKAATERIQVFEGVVIAKKHGLEPGASFTIRKIASASVAVEKIYPLFSPSIKKIEIVSRPKNVTQAKLYFLRKRVGKSARRLGLGEAVKETPAEPALENSATN